MGLQCILLAEHEHNKAHTLHGTATWPTSVSWFTAAKLSRGFEQSWKAECDETRKIQTFTRLRLNRGR